MATFLGRQLSFGSNHPARVHPVDLLPLEEPPAAAVAAAAAAATTATAAAEVPPPVAAAAAAASDGAAASAVSAAAAAPPKRGFLKKSKTESRLKDVNTGPSLAPRPMRRDGSFDDVSGLAEGAAGVGSEQKSLSALDAEVRARFGEDGGGGGSGATTPGSQASQTRSRSSAASGASRSSGGASSNPGSDGAAASKSSSLQARLRSAASAALSQASEPASLSASLAAPASQRADAEAGAAAASGGGGGGGAAAGAGRKSRRSSKASAASGERPSRSNARSRAGSVAGPADADAADATVGAIAAASAAGGGGGGGGAFIVNGKSVIARKRWKEGINTVVAVNRFKQGAEHWRETHGRGASGGAGGGSSAGTEGGAAAVTAAAPGEETQPEGGSAPAAAAAASAASAAASVEAAAAPKAKVPASTKEVAQHRWREGITAVIAANRFALAGAALAAERRRRVLAERRPAHDTYRRRASDAAWRGPESPARVLPYLLVGGREDAEDLPHLLQLGVTHVLNAAASLDATHAEHFLYLKLDLDDDDDEDVAAAFAMAIAFIADAKEGGGLVLVHCVAGMSRSVALVIAWLLYAERMNLRAALDLVRARRPIALPNPGFRLALARFEVQLVGATSVAGLHGDPAWNFAPWSKEGLAHARRRPADGRRPLSELGGVVAGTLIDGRPGPAGGGNGATAAEAEALGAGEDEAAGGCCSIA